MALAKADPRIARRYVQLWEDTETRERVWGLLDAELRLATSELLCVRGSGRLLDGEPVLQASIDRRNPFVDPLSFVQIELLSLLAPLLAVSIRSARMFRGGCLGFSGSPLIGGRKRPSQCRPSPAHSLTRRSRASSKRSRDSSTCWPNNV